MRLILAFLLLAPTAWADPPRIVGRTETVFDWSSQRCDTWDIPDSPARAWRDRAGRVNFMAASEATRLASGPDLDTLTRACPVIHAGAHADTPGAYDDRSWVAAPYLGRDGRLIALAHVEFHGHRRAGHCTEGTYAACWWNVIVELQSEDGRNFHRTAGPGDLVASPPRPYQPDQDHRTGYFNPSNIIAKDGYLYAFIFAENAPPQRRGACLIRRPETGGPKDWRAWDGEDFTVAFADPYRSDVSDPEKHVCKPLPGLGSTLSSVVRRAGTDEFLAVTPATLRAPDGKRIPGIWTTTSTDLIHWQRPELLKALPLLWNRECGSDFAYAYPSLIDPDSPDPNFGTVDDHFWLYLVKIALDPEGKTGPERDLIRLPLSWPAPKAEGTGQPDGMPAPSDPPDLPR
ncbi:hypothetical protein [Paenirhodobacter sp.]|uniref:hypothetical protein n=1 Tax=Paenirhodobacter sp. TaxID=1965326 RepID=UPI003B425ACF